MESKPNEPRGDIYMASTGAYLGLHPHARSPGDGRREPGSRARAHGRAELPARGRAGVGSRQAVPHRPERSGAGRYDQDFRFGAANIKAAFFLVKFLEDVGYDNPRHFDAHAYRTEDYDGVRDFARGCMRTYLILKEKAARWNADAEIQALVREATERRAARLEVLSGGPGRPARPAVRSRRDLGQRPGLREARSADDGSAARRQVASAKDAARRDSMGARIRPAAERVRLARLVRFHQIAVDGVRARLRGQPARGHRFHQAVDHLFPRTAADLTARHPRGAREAPRRAPRSCRSPADRPAR